MARAMDAVAITAVANTVGHQDSAVQHNLGAVAAAWVTMASPAVVVTVEQRTGRAGERVVTETSLKGTPIVRALVAVADTDPKVTEKGSLQELSAAEDIVVAHQ
jgi:hypothetical protein